MTLRRVCAVLAALGLLLDFTLALLGHPPTRWGGVAMWGCVLVALSNR